jgi:hypothetical protein
VEAVGDLGGPSWPSWGRPNPARRDQGPKLALISALFGDIPGVITTTGFAPLKLALRGFADELRVRAPTDQGVDLGFPWRPDFMASARSSSKSTLSQIQSDTAQKRRGV